MGPTPDRPGRFCRRQELRSTRGDGLRDNGTHASWRPSGWLSETTTPERTGTTTDGDSSSRFTRTWLWRPLAGGRRRSRRRRERGEGIRVSLQYSVRRSGDEDSRRRVPPHRGHRHRYRHRRRRQWCWHWPDAQDWLQDRERAAVPRHPNPRAPPSPQPVQRTWRRNTQHCPQPEHQPIRILRKRAHGGGGRWRWPRAGAASRAVFMNGREKQEGRPREIVVTWREQLFQARALGYKYPLPPKRARPRLNYRRLRGAPPSGSRPQPQRARRRWSAV